MTGKFGDVYYQAFIKSGKPFAMHVFFGFEKIGGNFPNFEKLIYSNSKSNLLSLVTFATLSVTRTIKSYLPERSWLKSNCK